MRFWDLPLRAAFASTFRKPLLQDLQSMMTVFNVWGIVSLTRQSASRMSEQSLSAFNRSLHNLSVFKTNPFNIHVLCALCATLKIGAVFLHLSLCASLSVPLSLYLPLSICNFFSVFLSFSLSLSLSLSVPALCTPLSLSPADNESVRSAFVQGPRLPTPSLTVWPGTLHQSPCDRVPGTPGVPKGRDTRLLPTYTTPWSRSFGLPASWPLPCLAPVWLSKCLALLEMR